MSVLQPLIDAGTVVIGSGQTGMDTVGTLRWDGAVAQSRMDNLLSANYTDKPVHGVLSPYDGLSIGILSSLKGVGYGSGDLKMPIVSGQDAEVPSVKSILAGEQYSTVFKDTREIHALVGENGAGKSTLMKVLSGVYPAGSYEGEILFDGRPAAFSGIADSEAKGIIIIHQELALVPLLSIAENLFLGNERAKGGVIDWRDTFRRAEGLLKKVGLAETPATLVDSLGVGKQQLVEIAKALSKDVRLLILDEPTAALSEADSQALLDLLLDLKAQGVTSIIISHKLNEVRRVADTVTVIRDGATVSTMDARTEDITEGRIVRDMVGRDMAHRYPERDRRAGEVILELRDWNVWHPEHSGRQVIKAANLTVRKGEVVGIAGLMGSGRTELAMSLFGRSYGCHISGEVSINGRPADVSTVPKAIAAGLAYVTEDRKSLGLILDETIQRNITLTNLPAVSSRGVITEAKETRVAEKYRAAMNIRTPSVFQKVMNLSGGNQQKVVLSKWLFAGPEVLILDEPTRGIDVGAKFEIYGIINTLSAEGKGVIMISSEMPELLGMCDRIYVMNEGALVGELTAAEASQERIMSLIVTDQEGTGMARAERGEAGTAGGIGRGESLADAVASHGIGAPVDPAAAYAEGRMLLPVDHPDPAHLHLTGTGLTHLGSAATRDAMHAKADPAEMTDSMKMFRMGLEGGRPAAGKVGAEPEWFYKGNVHAATAPGQPLLSPGFAKDAGEEPEIAGLYLIGPDGTPFRLGFALGNEFSDHVTERGNYLWLAHSKLRPAAFGPELLVGDLPADIRGQSRILRGGKALWQKPFLSGEANMSHSLANLEHHHFKYDIFRQPGDLHVHFFGTATLSFADGIRAEAGDVFEIEAPGFGLPLRNPLAIAVPDAHAVAVQPL